MSDTKPVLVLHLAAAHEPLFFALNEDDVDELDKKLHLMLDHRSVEAVTTKEGATVHINFSHVAVAYIDDLQRRSKVFGLR
ncbi:hypothetical protein [Amycolatopsis suaedae]|uniref:Uncharacterized protein n=1 Tax=Amycolatopsis suaedae TaxID=2510978 RepID=A0A4V2ELM0_9PSEU|nr:hypothetical protein [Amycolatopsis suaedae]RZQ62035.1 hypothetical protein EWH70_20805 [Amycolatopsis suaedae]